MQSAKKAQYPKYDYFDTPHTYRGLLNLRGVKGKEIKDALIVYEDDRFELLINVDIDKQDRPTGVEIVYHKGRDYGRQKKKKQTVSENKVCKASRENRRKQKENNSQPKTKKELKG